MQDRWVETAEPTISCYTIRWEPDAVVYDSYLSLFLSSIYFFPRVDVDVGVVSSHRDQVDIVGESTSSRLNHQARCHTHYERFLPSAATADTSSMALPRWHPMSDRRCS